MMWMNKFEVWNFSTHDFWNRNQPAHKLKFNILVLKKFNVAYSRKWDARLTLCTFSKAFTPTANIKHSLHLCTMVVKWRIWIRANCFHNTFICLLLRTYLVQINILPCSLTCSDLSVSYFRFQLEEWMKVNNCSVYMTNFPHA